MLYRLTLVSLESSLGTRPKNEANFGAFSNLSKSPTSTIIENYCYIRELGKEKLLVLCSFSEEEQLVELPDEFSGRKGITLISNYDKLIDLNNCIEDEKTVLLKAYEARVIYYN